MDDFTYTKQIDALQGTTMKIPDYLSLMAAHPRILSKLAELDLQSISFPDKYPEIRWSPAHVMNSSGKLYRVFFVFDRTPKTLVEQYVGWVQQHQDEIKGGKMNFLYIEDTKARRYYDKIEDLGLEECVIRRTIPQRYTRDKMISELQAMGDDSESVDMPATIDEIRVFGSVSRGNQIVGDADLYVKVSYSLEDLLRLFSLAARLGESPRNYMNSQFELFTLYHSIKEIGAERVRAAIEDAKKSYPDMDNEIFELLFEFVSGLDAKVKAGKETSTRLIEMVLDAGMHHNLAGQDKHHPSAAPQSEIQAATHAPPRVMDQSALNNV